MEVGFRETYGFEKNQTQIQKGSNPGFDHLFYNSGHSASDPEQIFIQADFREEGFSSL